MQAQNYKLVAPLIGNESVCVCRISDGAFIPFDPANTDYAEFKKAVMDGGELQDADGVVMTDAQEFVTSLP